MAALDAGYDAVLKWSQPSPEPDLAGYAIVMRSTTSPTWEREIYVGDVKEKTVKGPKEKLHLVSFHHG